MTKESVGFTLEVGDGGTDDIIATTGEKNNRFLNASLIYVTKALSNKILDKVINLLISLMIMISQK